MGPRAASLVCALLVVILAPRQAAAQDGVIDGLRTILDTTISRVTTTTTDASGAEVRTTSANLYPRLTLNTDALLLPSLRLNAGGVFEVNLTSIHLDTADVSSSASRLRPFFELRSTNQAFAPGIGYYRRQNRDRAGNAPAFTLVSEDYAAYLGLKPDALPQADLQFVRTNTFDRLRTSQDNTKDFGSILSRYDFKGLNLYYRGSFLTTIDRASQVDTRQVSHAGRVSHSQSLFKNRLQWNAIYHADQQRFATEARTDAGEVAIPVPPFAAFAGLSDTPLIGTLSANPLLIDGNLGATTGINLGVPAAGTDAQARNMAFDFSIPTEVNRLLVWVDRELPANIASAFSWEIYSSVDNITWRRETLVSVASFGTFENRFRVDFAPITSRYLKVVTRPLSAAVIDAVRYPDIFVTELQAFVVKSASDAGGSLTRTTQNLNADVRLRVFNTPLLYIESSYWRIDAPSGRRDTLSNGLSGSYRFGRVFSTSGRAAFERGQQSDGRRTATVSDATLTATPLRTFRASLLYTGLYERIGGRPQDRTGLSIQTNTQVYQGIDVQAGAGLNFTTRDTGETLHDRFVNLSGSVAPRDHLTLTFNYVDTKTERSGVFTGSPTLHTRSAYATLAFDPTRTLHLVLGEELVAIHDQKTRTTHNIGINWAPFPDGSLQFIVAYNEALRPLQFGTERMSRAGARWTLSGRSYVELSYQRIESRFVFQQTKSKILSLDLKFLL